MSVIRRTRLRLLIAALVIATTTLFAAPAGALTDPEEWGDTFCSETADWLSGAQAGADELAAQAEDPSLTPAAAKKLVVDYLETGVDDTKAFGQSIKRAGVPEVENGAKIQAAILGGIAGSGAKLAALERAAKAIPTKPITVYKKATSKIASEMSEFSEPFQKSLGKAEALDTSRALDRVLASLPSCDELARVAASI